MGKPEVVVVGSCMIDLCSYVSRLPKPGETLTGHKFQTCCGGKGANQCVSASRLGASTALVARLGEDVFGKDYLNALKSAGINTEHVTITPNQSSGMAQITVADSGENQIVIVPGANSKLNEKDVDKAKHLITEAKVVLFQMETPVETTIHALRLMKNTKALSIVNVAPAVKNLPPEMFELTNILCVNELEAEELTGSSVPSVDAAFSVAKQLQQMSPSKSCSVVLTLGEAGAVLLERGCTDPVHIPVPNLCSAPVVDSTGAGDSFLGAMAFFLSHHKQLTMSEIVSRACGVASFSVRKEGTQTSFPYSQELPSELFAMS